MVMPLWDDSPLKLPKLPLVTWGLIAANILVFVFPGADAGAGRARAAGVLCADAGQVTGAADTRPISRLHRLATMTLITYQFLHANIWHLLGNMIFLWVFGDDVEEAMGSLRFVAFSRLRGGGGAGLHRFEPALVLPLIGASGAIAGVLAAYLMFRPCQKVSVFLPWFILWFFVRGGATRYWVLGGWMLAQNCGRSRCRPRTGSPIGACRRLRGRGGAVSAAALPHRAAVRMHALGRAETGAQPRQLARAMRAAQHKR